MADALRNSLERKLAAYEGAGLNDLARATRTQLAGLDRRSKQASTERTTAKITAQETTAKKATRRRKSTAKKTAKKTTKK